MKTLVIISILLYFAAGDIDLQNVAIPEVNIDDFAAIREKCDKSGGPGTYDKLKTSKEALQTCLTQFANVSVFNDELEEAKKTGSMDEVFGKYCAKRPKLASCVQSFTNNLRPCLNNEENKALNVTLDVLKQLGDFVCFKNGDRLAMFVAEGGVECIKSRVDGIQNCVNSTFKITPTTVNTSSLPNLLMDQKRCADLDKLRYCVVDELEKCEDSTPANIIDALFKFVKRSACANKNKRSIRLHNILKRSAGFANDFYDARGMQRDFLNSLKAKCSQNAPDGGFEAFTLTFEGAVHCIRNKTTENFAFTIPVNTFKENIHRCVRKLIEKTEACLPEEEKYWPKFYMQAMLNLIDFIYKHKDLMRGIQYKRELLDCFQNFKEETAKKETHQCFEFPKNSTLSKEAICGNLDTMKDCLTVQYKKRCIRDVAITKIFDDFFEAVTSPCADDNEE